MPAQPNGEGRYFDGATASAQPVAVTLEDAAISIASAAGAPLARWEYSAVEHLPAPEHRLRLGLAGSASTARLEVRDPQFANAVMERLPFHSEQEEEKSERRRRHRVVEWSIGAVLAVLVFAAAGVPRVAELMLPLIPRSAEQRFGAAAHESARTSFSEKGSFECGDAGPKERAGKAVFVDLMRRLETAADLPVPVHAFVVRSRVVNAVAFPGGYTHIYMGLINLAESPEELGGVIAHELGHVAHRDSLRGFLHRAGISYVFGMVLGDVIGSGGIVVAAHRVLQNRNTRAQEAAADAFAVQVLTRLGADPHRYADLFERLMARTQPGRRMLLTRDHPTDADRVAAIRNAPGVPDPKPLLSTDDWKALKAVCSGA